MIRNTHTQGFYENRMEFPVVQVISGMLFHGKTKEKFYMNSGPELGEDLCGKNHIINKSLHGFKTKSKNQ
jgi:hypothetical protein